MSDEILKLQPKLVWKHFYNICQLPHPSKHEDKVRQYIVDFATEHGIEHIVDKIGNVMLRKGATAGMEDRKGVIFQGHMDMVPQKNSDKVFDFEKDAIQTFVDGEWVTADGTTLGADNGMGVATALAIFEQNDLAHGPIEALFTTDEETGMTGAFALEAGVLKGDILMNLDSEDEGELYVGCAGGVDVVASGTYAERSSQNDYQAYTVEVKGLRGGHSGMEIVLYRANANKLMFRFLKNAARYYGLVISSVDGGGLRNAIPREAFATVMVPASHSAEFERSVGVYQAIFESEYSAADPNVKITLSKADRPSTIMDAAVQKRLIDAVYACPNGVIRMSDEMHGLVETSLNMARVEVGGGNISVISLLRSSVNSAKADLVEMVSSVFELAGMRVESSGGYDGWKPNMESPILKTMLKCYKDLYGVDPKIKAIHAGLECGILGGTYPKWDMISLGPTIRFPHSPDEKVLIASVEKFYQFVVEVLKNVPKK